MAGLRVLLPLAPLALAAVACGGSSPERPVPAGDDVVRIVGGGERPVEQLEDGETVDATDVAVSRPAAMAVEPDGTVWVIHSNGEVLRADVGGELSRPFEGRKVGPIVGHAAATIGSDGDLYVVVGRPSILRLPLPEPEREPESEPESDWERIEPTGLPADAALTGIAVGDDGTISVADGLTGIVYEVGSDQTATAVADTGCGGERLDPPTAVRLTLTSQAEIVVSDKDCNTTAYIPGAGDLFTVPATCPGERDPNELSVAWPGPVIEVQRRWVVGGYYCRAVWAQGTDGEDYDLLADWTTVKGDPLALALDRDGIVYVLDDVGVLAMRRPR